MIEQEELTSDQRAWELVGAQDVELSIRPLHLHTVDGLRVKVTGIVVGGGKPRLAGTVFTVGGKVELRWDLDGTASSVDASAYRLHERHTEILSVLASMAARLN